MLDGRPDPPRERGNFGGKRSGHCKVMGHSRVSCANTSEAIEIPLWIKTRVAKETIY